LKEFPDDMDDMSLLQGPPLDASEERCRKRAARAEAILE
jgi:hypothetical protein